VTLTLAISQHDKGQIKCPSCREQRLSTPLSTFMSQTGRSP